MRLQGWDFYTTAEAGAVFGVSRQYAARVMGDGTWPAMRFGAGGCLVIARRDLLDLVRSLGSGACLAHRRLCAVDAARAAARRAGKGAVA